MRHPEPTSRAELFAICFVFTLYVACLVFFVVAVACL